MDLLFQRSSPFPVEKYVEDTLILLRKFPSDLNDMELFIGGTPCRLLKIVPIVVTKGKRRIELGQRSTIEYGHYKIDVEFYRNRGRHKARLCLRFPRMFKQLSSELAMPATIAVVAVMQRRNKRGHNRLATPSRN